jgi:hypothetical protein
MYGTLHPRHGHAQGSVLHPQRQQESLSEKVPEPTAGEALHDLLEHQDAHALIAHLAPWGEEQFQLTHRVHKLREAGVAGAELHIVG